MLRFVFSLNKDRSDPLFIAICYNQLYLHLNFGTYRSFHPNLDILILIATLVLHNWKRDYYIVLILVTAMGNQIELLQIFLPLTYLKYGALGVISILSILKLWRRRQLKANCMFFIPFAFDTWILFIFIMFFIMSQVALINLVSLMNQLVSSSWRFALLPIIPLSVPYINFNREFLKEGFIHWILIASVLLYFDNFFTVSSCSFWVPTTIGFLARLLPIVREYMEKKIPSIEKNRNYDLIVIMAFMIYHLNLWVAENYTLRMSKTYPFLFGVGILIIYYYKIGVIQKLFKTRAKVIKYKEFESARNDDTVL